MNENCTYCGAARVVRPSGEWQFDCECYDEDKRPKKISTNHIITSTITKHTAKRIKLDDVRAGLTMKDRGCGFKYYVTVNFYPNSGAPSEVFIRIAKEGTAISGFVEALAITISIAWQYGVPWAVLYDKYLHQIFEPRDDESSSLVDAIGKTIDKVIKKHGMDTTITGNVD